MGGTKGEQDPAQDVGYVNLVHLVGRITAIDEARSMPSGDMVVSCRVVVPRSGSGPGRGGVDALDVACWTKSTQSAVARIGVDGVAEVHGVLRRRFFQTGAGAASRYEVEATKVRRPR